MPKSGKTRSCVYIFLGNWYRQTLFLMFQGATGTAYLKLNLPLDYFQPSSWLCDYPYSSGPSCPLKACVVKARLIRMVLLGLSGAFKIWGDMKTEGRTIWGQRRGQQDEVSNQEGSGRQDR